MVINVFCVALCPLVCDLRGGEAAAIGRGGELERLLEEADEVLWVVETEVVGHVAHALVRGQQHLGALHHILVDGRHGILAPRLFHKVAEVVGREAELSSAIAHVGHTLLKLQSVLIVVVEHLAQTAVDTVGRVVLLKLPVVEALAVVEDELEKVENHLLAVCVRHHGALQFAPQQVEAAQQCAAFAGRQSQGVLVLVAQIVEVADASPQRSVEDERRVEEEKPSVELHVAAVVDTGEASWRTKHQRAASLRRSVDVVGQRAVGIVEHQQAVDVVVVAASGDGLQPREVHDVDVWMLPRRTDEVHVVVDRVDVEYLLFFHGGANVLKEIDNGKPHRVYFEYDVIVLGQLNTFGVQINVGRFCQLVGKP